MATNTIAGCALTAVAEETLPALQSLFAPLRGIVTDFSNEPVNAVAVNSRYPTKPTAVDLSSGYTAQDTTLTIKTVTVNTFYGYVWAFSDYERSLNVKRLNDLFIEPALQATGDKVFGDIWNLVTAGNFATSTTIAAANFDRNDLVDIGVTLTDTKKAPTMNRTAWLNPSYYGQVVKSLNSAEFPGQSVNKSEAIAPRVAKFDIYESDLMDNNSAALAGFCFHKSALMMKANRIDAEMATQAGVSVVDSMVPGLDLPVQFRRWYDPTAGSLYYSVGILYGVAAGRDFGVRITSS